MPTCGKAAADHGTAASRECEPECADRFRDVFAHVVHGESPVDQSEDSADAFVAPGQDATYPPRMPVRPTRLEHRSMTEATKSQLSEIQT